MTQLDGICQCGSCGKSPVWSISSRTRILTTNAEGCKSKEHLWHNKRGVTAKSERVSSGVVSQMRLHRCYRSRQFPATRRLLVLLGSSLDCRQRGKRKKHKQPKTMRSAALTRRACKLSKWQRELQAGSDGEPLAVLGEAGQAYESGKMHSSIEAVYSKMDPIASKMACSLVALMFRTPTRKTRI